MRQVPAAAREGVSSGPPGVRQASLPRGTVRAGRQPRRVLGRAEELGFHQQTMRSGWELLSSEGLIGDLEITTYRLKGIEKGCTGSGKKETVAETKAVEARGKTHSQRDYAEELSGTSYG